ncbi:MAG: CRISPR-associated endonuclease Cas2 [Candidatus Competibacteraceae bacterium]|nr:CRISPR-associated endonuclease Cas2 [Candidatus Competibacteraceae bacterium]
MPDRALYLAAYDVTNADRLQAALRVLKGYASGGQKSVFECFLTARERTAMLVEIRGVLDTAEDRFLLLPLPDAGGIRALGVAIRPSDPEFYYVGCAWFWTVRPWRCGDRNRRRSSIRWCGWRG